ncbi:MAG TPA: hypothetical protein VNY27_03735 [Solirubrobacteraceae bacterium]|jgi:hypothetical protein|nr:hypothetical protein [Solirubrobacteraceae bacterium]
MRAAALLQRLPHAADTERRRRPRRHRHVPRTPAAGVANLHLAAPASGPDASIARVRLAGGPIDNASYTCGCGFVFAASVSTTVRCPHCGADQAW